MKIVLPLLICLLPLSGFAEPPALEQHLPLVVIEDRGEIMLDSNEFSYRTWRSDRLPGGVHVLQYFAGTKAASELFAPFTDRLQEVLDPASYHVSTIINLDAALWGTAGFVVSEVKGSKREYPLATMVLDENGLGAKTWQLGSKGALLAILDGAGRVQFMSREALTPTQIEAQVDWMKQQVTAAVATTAAASAQ